MPEFISLAAGLLVPIIVSWLKKSSWPDAAKVVLTLIVCMVLGVGTTAIGMYASGNPWKWGDLIANLGLVFTSATTFYKTFFQGTNFNRDTLEPGGPLEATRPPQSPVERGLEQAATYAGTINRPNTLYLDAAGNEVDPKFDLDDGAKPEHRSRIYPGTR